MREAYGGTCAPCDLAPTSADRYLNAIMFAYFQVKELRRDPWDIGLGSVDEACIYAALKARTRYQMDRATRNRKARITMTIPIIGAEVP